MKLVPLGDKVVLKQLEAEETTKSGIVLPGTAKEKPQQAEVVAVGPGGVIDGKEVVMQVKVGDKVIYQKYAGTDVKLGEDKYEITIYSSCCNLDLGIYYYTTYENSQISAVDMHHENLDGDTVVPYDLIKGQQVHYQN